jgi:hypothetical protein
MSHYTNKMIFELRKIGSFDYDSAAAYASANNLSTRSVISKVKSLDLPYTPRPKRASTGPRLRKADVVDQIASSLGVHTDTIAGLSKADMASLQTLLKAI